MFKDTKEGETHSYNDGCGEPAHNPKLPQHIEKRFDEKFDGLYDLGTPNMDNPSAGSEIHHYNELKSFIATILDEEKVRILQERDMTISMLYRNWKRRPLADETDFDDVIAKLSI